MPDLAPPRTGVHCYRDQRWLTRLGHGQGLEPARHRRRHSLSNEDRLRALGEPHAGRPRGARVHPAPQGGAPPSAAGGGGGGGAGGPGRFRWFGPVPSPSFVPAGSASVHLRGTLPSLPWPTDRRRRPVGGGRPRAWVRSGPTEPAPIAGLATVMTAYVVLKDHPLAVGADRAGDHRSPQATDLPPPGSETSSSSPMSPWQRGEP